MTKLYAEAARGSYSPRSRAPAYAVFSSDSGDSASASSGCFVETATWTNASFPASFSTAALRRSKRNFLFRFLSSSVSSTCSSVCCSSCSSSEISFESSCSSKRSHCLCDQGEVCGSDMMKHPLTWPLQIRGETHVNPTRTVCLVSLSLLHAKIGEDTRPMHLQVKFVSWYIYQPTEKCFKLYMKQHTDEQRR